MNHTFDDIKQKLLKEDELTFLEILDLTTEELVDLLEDTIYEKQNKVRLYYGEDLEPEEDEDY